MSHPWETYVLGGVAEPRFLILNPQNWCSNPYFMDGDNSGYGGGTFPTLQTEQRKEAYAEYMGKIYYSAMSPLYVQLKKTLSTSPLNRTFMFSFRYMSMYPTRVSFVTDADDTDDIFETLALPATSTPQRIVFVSTIDTVPGAGANIAVHIYGSQATQADMLFDQVALYEVTNDIEMPQPQRSYLLFEEVLTGSHERWDGLMQKVNRRWRPHYYAEYEFMEAATETKRQQINDADLLFCIPHKDSSWGILGQWEGDFSRRYPWDRFKGHTGAIPIRGSEFLLLAPTWQADTGESIYVEQGQLIIPS